MGGIKVILGGLSIGRKFERGFLPTGERGGGLFEGCGKNLSLGGAPSVLASHLSQGLREKYPGTKKGGKNGNLLGGGGR